MHGQQHLASGRRSSTLKEPLMQVLIAILSLLTFLFAYPALAQRSPEEAGFPGGGSGGPPAGRLLERLIAPCRTACFDTVRICHDTAEADALASAQSACATEIQTAQSACALLITGR